MIELVDLKRQYALIRTELHEAMERVMSSAGFILGEEVEKFEEEFACFCGVKHAVGVATGTDALLLSLKALGIGEGDEVITVPFTFVATALAIHHAGARPVFVDVDAETRNMDVAQIESAITPRTRAIMPVHLYGVPADMEPILKIAEKYGLAVIEDACQAHGALYRGKRCGGIGTLGCFSFYPSKNLGAYGDGGIVLTDDDELAGKIKMLRVYGAERRDYCIYRGYNSRLDALQASILRVKLRYLEEWNRKRREAVQRYNCLLRELPLKTPSEPNDTYCVYHLYVVETERREELREKLKQRDIATAVHYPCPIHSQKSFRDLGYHEGDFPVSERLSRTVLSLPMFPELTESEIEHICSIIRKTIQET